MALLRTCAELFVRLSCRPVLACLLAALFPIALRLLLLPWSPPPVPAVQDEFSYLLGADTLAHGRLTNPRHPHWQHFESFQILQTPVYVSKYPLGQAAFLALGQLLGHPWFGVLLSIGCMTAAICWMLRNWLLPPPVALLGALVAGCRFGAGGHWVDSYWGGAVASLGGALVIGALGGLVRPPSNRRPGTDAYWFAAGAVILANTRPYEGALLLAVAAFVWILRTCKHAEWAPLLRIHLARMSLVLLPAAAGMAFYNFLVTGSPWMLPYQLHEEQYTVATAFIWQSPRPVPAYRHAVFHQLWVDWELTLLKEAREQFVQNLFLRPVIGLRYVLGAFLLVPLALIPLPVRNRIDRLTLPLLLVALLGFAPMKQAFIHYWGPVVPLVYLRVTNLLSSVAASGMGRFRRIAVVVVASMCAIMVAARGFEDASNRTIEPLIAKRDQVIRQLTAHPGGRHLVFVRYDVPAHPVQQEWVYNAADIDASAIVWARSMTPEQDARLSAYYGASRINWILDPDAPGGPRLQQQRDPQEGRR